MHIGGRMVEIDNLLEKIKKEDGVIVKVEYDMKGYIVGVYLDKTELYPNISFENITELYRLCSCFTNHNPDLLVSFLSYYKLNSIDYLKYQKKNLNGSIVDVVKCFLNKEHPPKKDFNWYMNILFERKEYGGQLYIDWIWEKLKNDEWLSKESIFLDVSNFFLQDNAITAKQYIENVYGKEHSFKFLFVNNSEDKNYYDILNRPMQVGIHIEKL